MSIFSKIISWVAGAEVASALHKPTTEYKDALPKSVVRKGSKGDDVKAVQRFLNWCIKAGLAIDGVAGAKTVKAIKKFQKQYGLKTDGIFGAKSAAKARELIKQYKSTATTQGAKSAASTTKRTPQDKICAYAKMIADSKKFKYVKWKGSDKKTQTCPICQKRVTVKVTYDESKNKFTLKSFKVNDKHAIGGNCLWTAFSPWKHGAGIPIKCSCHTIASDTGNRMYKAKTVADALKIAQQSVGIKDIKVIRNKKGIPTSEMKKGDVLLHFSGGSYRHATLYVGNGKLHDATGGRNPNIKYGTKLSGWYKNNPPKILVRYEGK